MKWWKWLLSIPKSKNPAFDFTGINASEGQLEKNIFYLCQTMEGGDFMPTRTATIPSGKCIFMPIINWISVMGFNGDTELELINLAKRKMNVVSHLNVIVNGWKLHHDLNHYRAQSPPFWVDLPKNNILELPYGQRMFVSDGYWVCFQLAGKKNRLTTFGSCSSGATKYGICYDLNT